MKFMPVYIFSLLQVSKHLENCRSFGDTNLIMPCVYVKCLSASRVCNSNKKSDQSSVTFMHNHSLNPYFAASFKSFILKIVEVAETRTPLCPCVICK